MAKKGSTKKPPSKTPTGMGMMKNRRHMMEQKQMTKMMSNKN